MKIELAIDQIEAMAIARITAALDRIDDVLNIYAAVRELASRGWKLDA